MCCWGRRHALVCCWGDPGCYGLFLIVMGHGRHHLFSSLACCWDKGCFAWLSLRPCSHWRLYILWLCMGRCCHRHIHTSDPVFLFHSLLVLSLEQSHGLAQRLPLSAPGGHLQSCVHYFGALQGRCLSLLLCCCLLLGRGKRTSCRCHRRERGAVLLRSSGHAAPLWLLRILGAGRRGQTLGKHLLGQPRRFALEAALAARCRHCWRVLCRSPSASQCGLSGWGLAAVGCQEGVSSHLCPCSCWLLAGSLAPSAVPLQHCARALWPLSCGSTVQLGSSC